MSPPNVATTTLPTDAQSHSTEPPTTLGEMLLSAAGRHHGVALQYCRDGTNVSISYPELGARVTEIARGLIQKDGDTVRLIYALPTGEVPAGFKTKEKQLLFVMKKVK